MSLANVACLLGRDLSGSERVLAIDWDLEAPGLDFYLPPLGDANSRFQRQGVVELFTQLSDGLLIGSLPSNEDELAEKLLDMVGVDRFIYPTKISNVSIMPAGHFDSSYQTRVRRLDWENIYTRCPAIYRAFAHRLAREYAVVLVDSRTGMTDISGVCTALLPEKLVVVFTPNRQSLSGIESLVQQSTSYRKGSKDIRPLMVYPLPCRIDGQLETLRHLWRYGDSTQDIEGYQPQFERILKNAYGLKTCDLTVYFDEVQVQHSPEHSYGESIAAASPITTDRLSIVRSYEALVKWLSVSAAPWELPEDALRRKELQRLIAEEVTYQFGDNPRRHIEHLEKVVELSRSIRGEQHPDTFAAIHRLVELLIDTSGEIPHAVTLLDDLINNVSFIHGPQRWRLVETVLESSGKLRKKGHLADAERLLHAMTVVLISEHAVRSDEIELATAVASRLLAAGTAVEAQGLFERILDTQTQLFGSEHPETLHTLTSLALTVQMQGNAVHARELFERVVEICERIYGQHDSQTLTALSNLAEASRAEGDLAVAKALTEKVLETRQQVLGEEHSDTLASMRSLASILASLGEEDQARDMLRHIVKTHQRLKGDDHPETLAAMRELAELLKEVRIFISYKRNVEPDEQLAIKLLNDLSTAGYRVFIDQTLTVGQDWARTIHNELQSADYFIVLLSNESIQSDVLSEEVHVADAFYRGQGKPVILPVRVRYDGTLPYDLGAILNRMQSVGWRSAADTQNVVAAIRAAVRVEGAMAPALLGTPPVAPPVTLPQIGSPEGVLDPVSALYIERTADRIACEEQLHRRYTLVIKGPTKSGKTSFLVRIVARARQAGSRVVLIDFQGFGNDDIRNPQKLYYQFCYLIEDGLALDPQLNQYWDNPLAPQQKCTRFMERRVLPACKDDGLLLALDETDALLEGTTHSDFFAMLRSWHNRFTSSHWESFSLVLTSSSEPALLIDDLAQSPFNVGTTLVLEDFTFDETRQANQLHGSPLNPSELEQLQALLSGHPYLTRKTLYLLVRGRITFSLLLREAASESGPFGPDLRSILLRLSAEKEEVIEGVRVILSGDSIAGYAYQRLVAVGLIKHQNGQIMIRNCLYEKYLRRVLHV